MSILDLLEAGSAKTRQIWENATLGTVPSQTADGVLYLRIVLLLQQLIATIRAGLMSAEAASRG
jgi:hypothetical protein